MSGERENPLLTLAEYSERQGNALFALMRAIISLHTGLEILTVFVESGEKPDEEHQKKLDEYRDEFLKNLNDAVEAMRPPS